MANAKANHTNNHHNVGPFDSVNRFPHWLNRLQRRFLNQFQDSRVILAHEPNRLNVFTKVTTSALGQNPTLIKQEMDLETFKLVLEQVPTTDQVTFCGQGEPLLLPDLFKMVNYAWRFNKAKTTISCTPKHLSDRSPELLNSQLNTLIIRLAADKPSTFHRMTGKDAREFVQLENNLRSFLTARKHYAEYATKSHSLRVELHMVVDNETYKDIPDRVYYAETLGVDAIVFENFLSPGNNLPTNELSCRTITPKNTRAVEYLSQLDLTSTSIPVTLPVILELDMSHYRNCSDPYHTVGVSGDCTIHPCSFQAVDFIPPEINTEEETSPIEKIWDADFWNGPTYQWFRKIHHSAASPGNKKGKQPSTLENTQNQPVPLACQHCPKNMTHTLKAISIPPPPVVSPSQA